MPTYNTVSVSGTNIFGNSLGEIVTVSVTPLSVYFDTPNNIEINPQPISVVSDANGLWTITGIIDPTPDNSGMAWTLNVRDRSTGQVLYNQTVQIAFKNGASQNWLTLTTPPQPANVGAFMTAPSGTANADSAPVASGSGSASSWLYVNEHIDIRNYGAIAGDSSKATANTTAINNAFSDVANANVKYGKIRIPKGRWWINGALNYPQSGGGSKLSVNIEGDTPSGGTSDGSVLYWVPGSSGYNVLNITGAWNCLLRNLTLQPSTAANKALGHTGIVSAGSSWFRMENVNCYGTGTGSPSGGPANGLLLGPDGSASIHACDIEAQTMAFQLGDNAPGCAVTNSLFQAIAGNGGACMQMYGSAGTLECTNVVTEGGDYGIQMITDGTSNPEFLFLNNFQVNNAGITGGDFANGTQVFANQFWATANNLQPALTYGLHFGSSFLGGATFTDMNIGAFGGHGIWIEGGKAYSFKGGFVGGCGKHTSNTYDDIRVESAASIVKIMGVDFDNSPFNGLTSPAARSAVNNAGAAGNVALIGNSWKASGYGTSSTIGSFTVNTGNQAI